MAKVNAIYKSYTLRDNNSGPFNIAIEKNGKSEEIFSSLVELNLANAIPKIIESLQTTNTQVIVNTYKAGKSTMTKSYFPTKFKADKIREFLNKEDSMQKNMQNSSARQFLPQELIDAYFLYCLENMDPEEVIKLCSETHDFLYSPFMEIPVDHYNGFSKEFVTAIINIVIDKFTKYTGEFTRRLGSIEREIKASGDHIYSSPEIKDVKFSDGEIKKLTGKENELKMISRISDFLSSVATSTSSLYLKRKSGIGSDITADEDKVRGYSSIKKITALISSIVEENKDNVPNHLNYPLLLLLIKKFDETKLKSILNNFQISDNPSVKSVSGIVILELLYRGINIYETDMSRNVRNDFSGSYSFNDDSGIIRYYYREEVRKIINMVYLSAKTSQELFNFVNEITRTNQYYSMFPLLKGETPSEEIFNEMKRRFVLPTEMSYNVYKYFLDENKTQRKHAWNSCSLYLSYIIARASGKIEKNEKKISKTEFKECIKNAFYNFRSCAREIETLQSFTGAIFGGVDINRKFRYDDAYGKFTKDYARDFLIELSHSHIRNKTIEKIFDSVGKLGNENGSKITTTDISEFARDDELRNIFKVIFLKMVI